MAADGGNKTRFALLGLLATGRSLSGYDLKRIMDRSVNYFWSESYGQIYPTLRRLAEAGLAEARETEARGRAGRIAYRITPQGQQALKAWLAEPPLEEKHRDEVLLQLFFGRHADVAQQAAHLKQRLTALRALAAEYDALRQTLEQECADEPDLPYWLITLRWGQHWAAARIAWVEETLAELKRLDPRPAGAGGQRAGAAAGKPAGAR